jgi:hypothetical protein
MLLIWTNAETDTCAGRMSVDDQFAAHCTWRRSIHTSKFSRYRQPSFYLSSPRTLITPRASIITYTRETIASVLQKKSLSTMAILKAENIITFFERSKHPQYIPPIPASMSIAPLIQVPIFRSNIYELRGMEEENSCPPNVQKLCKCREIKRKKYSTASEFTNRLTISLAVSNLGLW